MSRRAAANEQPWVVGPLGERLTLDMLPKPGTHRWVIRRKAQLVAAVEGKLLSVNELLRRYRVTPTEYENWKAAVAKHGLAGLRLTRAQDYREIEQRFPGLDRHLPPRRR
jgi:hypothetical protein